MKVLAVDDRKEDLYLLNKILEKKGFEVISAANGKEAFEKIRDNPPDLVISDILMPEVDGYQLLKKVKSSKELSEIPFVFYTATYTSKKDEEFAYSLGASRFIVKPQEPDTFLKLLSKTITDHQEGILIHSEEELENEEIYLKEYNQRLVEKLEDKVGEVSKARDLLLDSHTFLNSIVNSVNDGLIFIDINGNVKLTNELGKKLEKAALEIVLPKLEAGEDCTGDIDLSNKGREYDICCSPVSTKENKYLGTAITIHDITDRKKVKIELDARVMELEKWQRLTVGREIKMIELKKEIKELEKEIRKLKKKSS